MNPDVEKFNIKEIRSRFPILGEKINNKNLVYLDNAATTQKPVEVLDCIKNYYEKYNANVHRGIHFLSQIATEEMEKSRICIHKFINSKYPHEVIFTKGTTEAINLVAYSLTEQIKNEDEIIISHLEHHSNIVPWQMLCQRTGAKLRVIPMNEEGALQIDVLDEWLSEKTKLVSINHISNALGIVNNIEKIVQKIRQKSNALIFIDGAQSAPHFHIDVQKIDCDFFAFSGHKIYGPTGTGIIYGKESVLERLSPFHGGGEMIERCTFQKTTYAELPFKFEAGTPNIAGNIALGKAVDFIEEIGRNKIHLYEKSLLKYAQKELRKISELEIYGEKAEREAVISFNVNGVNAISSDVGMILDKMGIAVRTGHHCAQPIMEYLGISGTVRASFAMYNTFEEVDQLTNGIKKAIKMLK